MCDKDTCNDASCCGECEPWNCLEQQINDALATKEEQLQGYVDEAKDAAAESKASAEASAQSAAESKEFRDEAETAANTAVAAEGVVLGVANTLQDTADKLEQIADELGTAIAGVAVSSWFYTTVSENQTVIPVPADKNAVDVQSIYIKGARQSPFRGFEFDKTAMIITLAEPLPLGLEIEIILGTYNSDNPNDFAHTIASNNGASLVGTTSGATVQQEINNLREEIADTDAGLRDDLAANTGATLIGLSNTLTLQGYVDVLTKQFVPVELFRKAGLTDDQVIMQADAVAAVTKAKVSFEAGKTYTVTSVSPSVTWLGNGATLKRKAATGSTLVEMKSNAAIINFTIDGNKANASAVVATVNLNNISGALVKSCTVLNAGEHGIQVIHDFDTSINRTPNAIINNIVHGVTGSGIYLYDALYTKIKGNEVYECGNGILGQGSKRTYMGVDIISNSCHNNTDGGIAIVLMSDAEDKQAYEKVKILSNRVFGNGNNGIAVQADLALVSHNHVWANGSLTSHQGILVNANGVVVTSNTITDNAGVGIDFGDCRKCSATANHIENNGWIGIEVNSCEQISVTGNVLNLNFAGKTGGDLQAAILVYKGDGGYPFLGDCIDITVVGNTIRSGDGQQYAILVGGTNCYKIVITGNTCKTAGLVDDIVTRSPDVIAKANYTRWDVGGLARAVINSGGVDIPSVADTVSVNGTGSVITVNIADGAFVKDRVVRLVAVHGFTLEARGSGTVGNIYIPASIALAAGDSTTLWSDGSGGWKKA